MAELEFQVLNWLASDHGDEAARTTTGSLVIRAGDTQVPLTEVEDRLARTVREHINVPMVSLAEWLIVHWWRLRWEARPTEVGVSWRRAHSLASITGGDVWPDLEISSDGAFVQLVMQAEDRPDVSAIRFLRNLRIDVPAREFEAAVDRLLDVVGERLAATVPGYRLLAELREELHEERCDPLAAHACRLEARAGFDPGDSPDGWLDRALALARRAGPAAAEEVMGVLPELGNRLEAAEAIIAKMQASATSVDRTWVERGTASPRELPWQAGARMARQVRAARGLGEGPLGDDVLSELLSVHLPLQGTLAEADSPLAGGYRNGSPGGRVRLGLTHRRPVDQRFFLSRVIGAASMLDVDEHLLPVTNGLSALQKAERSFAQEFLCPWAALDAYTTEHGTGDDALADAADHFRVSERVIRSTLVNKHKLSRDRLFT